MSRSMESATRRQAYGLCMHTQSAMTKTISLSDDAYEALAGLKEPGESFSDVALRLASVQRQRSVLNLLGAWKDLLSDEDAEELKARIRKWRDEDRKPVKW